MPPKKNTKRALPADHPAEQAPASKKSKEASTTNGLPSPRFPSPPQEPITEHDKTTWKGWCEIESEPAFFSAMIREMGVQGISVCETVALDVDDFDHIPQPIFGLILLMRWRETDPDAQEEECPDNVWFANQLPGQNSCATLAMINILMNLNCIDIGENLAQFKDFTSNMTPYQRGLAFTSFDFVKNIHNSYATKMDMLEADKHLAIKVSKAAKASKKKEPARRRGSHDSRANSDSDESIEDNAHHFIALLPIDGQVWKLDGIDSQPSILGTYKDDKPKEWLEVALTHIQGLMAAAGDADYNLLALVQAPLHTFRKRMCKSVKTLQLVESCLDATGQDWRPFLVTDSAIVPPTPTMLESMGITHEEVATAEVPIDKQDAIKSEESSELISRRGKLVEEQVGLQDSILNEITTVSNEDEKAKERKWDYGPAIKKWLELLATNGYLQGNIGRHKG